ncbi:hypothetical protein [Streptomyces sp. ME19-01-6]|nr:hypothetical protein [Streptomyces sp. ME19-01-6]MDX3233365.1 hypothetical protein [Streptomyces sp. ME19-01-6]
MGRAPQAKVHGSWPPSAVPEAETDAETAAETETGADKIFALRLP